MILDLMPNKDDKSKITTGVGEGYRQRGGGSGGQHIQPDGLGERAQLLEQEGSLGSAERISHNVLRT
jgi:hypothetical protein